MEKKGKGERGTGGGVGGLGGRALAGESRRRSKLPRWVESKRCREDGSPSKVVVVGVAGIVALLVALTARQQVEGSRPWGGPHHRLEPAFMRW